jgi:heat shock protein HtpX
MSRSGRYLNLNSTNTIKTVLLLAALTAVLLVAGRIIAGPGGMTIALIFALVMNLGAYWFSDKIALSMAGAKEATIDEAPELHSLVERLAANAGLPKPRVYIIDNPSPNAFATGRDPHHSAVAVTTGIAGLLDREELAGVIAHELAHIRNRDTLIATIAAAIAGAITYLAYMAQWAMIFGGFGREDDDGGGIGSLVGSLLLIILAPVAAMVIQMAISRAREYDADATGARILGNPLPLASALAKLQAGVQYRPMKNAKPATAPLYIVNPFSGGGFSSLFTTHPPIEERIARLRAMY